MSTNYPINPRVRAYGKARLDIAGRAKNAADWEKLWKPPSASFPFVWGETWKQCVEYRVDDFAAEVGFFIDVLGLPVNAFDPGYAMFTSPHGDFFFAVVPTPQAEQSTPPDAIRLQFMVKDLLATAHELEQRGIFFEQPPQPLRPGSSLSIGSFRTPNGISVELWGMVKAATLSDVKISSPENQADGDEDDDEEDDLEEGDLVEDEGDDGDEDEELNPGEAGNGKEDLVEDDNEDEEEDLVEDEGDNEDEDEFDQDEYSSTLKSKPQKANLSYHPQTPRDARSNVQDKSYSDQRPLPLVYIDVDAT